MQLHGSMPCLLSLGGAAPRRARAVPLGEPGPARGVVVLGRLVPRATTPCGLVVTRGLLCGCAATFDAIVRICSSMCASVMRLGVNGERSFSSAAEMSWISGFFAGVAPEGIPICTSPSSSACVGSRAAWTPCGDATDEEEEAALDCIERFEFVPKSFETKTALPRPPKETSKNKTRRVLPLSIHPGWASLRYALQLPPRTSECLKEVVGGAEEALATQQRPLCPDSLCLDQTVSFLRDRSLAYAQIAQ